MGRRFLFYIGGIVLSFLGLVACSDDNKGGEDMNPPLSKAQHTVLMYMAVDNSLYSETSDVLNKLLRGVNISGLNNCNLVVYLDNLGEFPRLMSVRMGDGGKAEWQMVCSYEEQDSSSPEVMNKIIQEVASRFPSDTYSLIVSSHGMGWIPIVDSYAMETAPEAMPHLPDGIGFLDSSVATRAFIQDRGNWMEIDEFCSAVPDGMFEYILFDAC